MFRGYKNAGSDLFKFSQDKYLLGIDSRPLNNFVQLQR